MLRIGIDVGGTFTDFVVFDPASQGITTYKLPTDASNPASTVLQGLQMISADAPAQIIHGSTVATNALLERKGARTALITTQGFKDILQIARQNRPSLYDWNAKPAPPLVPQEYRLEVDERVDYQGKILASLDSSEVEQLVPFLLQNKIESVAICLLFSFLYPGHEQMIADQLRQSGFSVSVSSEILPEFREYERTSTTVVNAYVSPILDHYLSDLDHALPISDIQIMQSNGGMISLREARRNGVRCILSGPAGGIVGVQNIAQTIASEKKSQLPGQLTRLITFDMGGTSTDVSLINGQPSLTTDSSVGGCPIHLPLLDIHTIGAGGGSIAYVDVGGALRVGPQSAGADPGPACYGKGELPTVTDANLVLGRLLPGRFLGGKMPIDPDRAYKALAKLGATLGMNPIEAAHGVIAVVNAQMERALRVISVERGYDPADFSLFSFGGAGGLHAGELARSMGIPKVIISKYASTLSAYGMLASNVVKDYVKTVMLPATTANQTIEDLFTPMISQGLNEVRDEGIQPDRIEVITSVDVRFVGQSYELNVPFSEQFIMEFYHVHQLSYGYTYTGMAIEIVNLRVRVAVKIDPIRLPRMRLVDKQGPPAPFETRQVELPMGHSNVHVYDYDRLSPGTQLTGPALVVTTDTTILVNPDDQVFVDEYQNLLIDIDREVK